MKVAMRSLQPPHRSRSRILLTEVLAIEAFGWMGVLEVLGALEAVVVLESLEVLGKAV
jgi:hypothetical protein